MKAKSTVFSSALLAAALAVAAGPARAQLAGRYQGSTSAGQPIELAFAFDDRTGAVTLVELQLEFDAQCPPGSRFVHASAHLLPHAVVMDRSFEAHEWHGPLNAVLRGRFDASGTLAGSFSAHTFQTIEGGQRPERCTSADMAFTAFYSGPQQHAAGRPAATLSVAPLGVSASTTRLAPTVR